MTKFVTPISVCDRLPLTSSFLLKYSSEYFNKYLNEYSTVLVNTGSSLIQAANDEWVVGQRTWDPKGQDLEQHPSTCIYLHYRFTGWQVANEIAKPQVSMNSYHSSIDCK